MPASTCKLILSGDTVHLYQYSRPIPYDNPKKIQKTRKYIPDNEANDQPADFDANSFRCRKAVKLILESNSGQYFAKSGKPYTPLFITLTFADNIQRVQQANPIFKKFVQRLNYRISEKKVTALKYLVVPEFQKKGRVHYHAVFFNLPYRRDLYDVIKETWSNGYVLVKSVKNTQHLTNYVTKYITKENRDERLANQKKYFCSRDMFRPVEFREEDFVSRFLLGISRPADFTKSYTNEERFLTTTYSCFRFTKPMRQQFLTTVQYLQSTKLKTTSTMVSYYFL